MIYSNRSIFSGFLLLFCLTFLHSVGHSQGKPVFFNNYRKLADSLSNAYGIPSCVILSVSYLESGGGVSVLAKKLNNHFGIVGDCKFEVSKHKSKYKYYPTAKDSYIAFCKLVANKKFYSSMKGSKDEKLWFEKIAATGYAADAKKWSAAAYKICLNQCK